MKYTIFILTLVLTACSPKLTTNYVNQSYPIVSSFESFGIVENGSIGFDETDFIGQIELKDNSISINCDYWTIMEQMKREARKAGGNLLRIDEHKNHQPTAVVVIKSKHLFSELITQESMKKNKLAPQ